MMMMRALCFFVLLSLGGLNSFAQPAPVEIAFTVGMSRPHTHLFEVDVRSSMVLMLRAGSIVNNARLDARLLPGSRV